MLVFLFSNTKNYLQKKKNILAPGSWHCSCCTFCFGHVARIYFDNKFIIAANNDNNLIRIIKNANFTREHTIRKKNHHSSLFISYTYILYMDTYKHTHSLVSVVCMCVRIFFAHEFVQVVD